MEMYPDKPFEYTFVDEDVAKQYDKYKRWMNITGLATAFAILIASLGLFGLAGINAINRTKEIGIRKVLGAELIHIAKLLLGNTTRQIAIASVIGIPIAVYLIQQYLMKFTERIELQWWHYVTPIALLVIILLILQRINR